MQEFPYIPTLAVETFYFSINYARKLCGIVVTLIEGGDYQGLSQVIEFTAESTMTVPVVLVDDSVVEGSEWFIGHLRGTTNNGVILTSDSINITIIDDDSKLRTLISWQLQAETFLKVSNYGLHVEKGDIQDCSKRDQRLFESVHTTSYMHFFHLPYICLSFFRLSPSTRCEHLILRLELYHQ